MVRQVEVCAMFSARPGGLRGTAYSLKCTVIYLSSRAVIVLIAESEQRVHRFPVEEVTTCSRKALTYGF